ncbi:sodium- and chloride-dependent taurine transporter-like [Argonauta hians]
MTLTTEFPDVPTVTMSAVSNGSSSTDDSSITISDESGSKIKKRETWGRKLDFLLACIGFSVGLGNVWRFPFLCYKNGGGAFLIPYLLAVILGGVPVFFLEVSLGQFMSEGGVGAWKICPLFQGIGYACSMIVFFLDCNYNIILTWSFYYLFSSFTSVLPWSSCGHEWNSENCTEIDFYNNASLNALNSSYGIDDMNLLQFNDTANYIEQPVSLLNKRYTKPIIMDPITEFWERKVLNISDGVEHPGTIKWDLALCLLLAWIVVYFCIWKGIKSSGKVMYFTATSPYILMLVLLIRGVTLDGAVDGLKYYLIPDWGRLLDRQVWVDAGTQIFFSYSISLGTLTALGSYNKFHHNSYKDSILFAIANTFTSFLAGFVIFSVLGFMAKRQGLTIDEVAESGPGLAFIAYPEAVSQMPVAPLWSIVFFVMIILLGLDSQFVGVEGFITTVVDRWPQHLRRGYRREILIGFVCLMAFAVGLTMVTNGGMYVFQLFDYYPASRIVLLVAFFECVVVAYIYGVDRFYDNLEMMYGFRLSKWMKYCWMYLTPGFTLIVFVLSTISYSELTYKRKVIEYHYPHWAVSIGWVMACSSIIFIPVVMLINLYKTKGSLKTRIEYLLRPMLKSYQLRPNEDLTKVTLITRCDYDCEPEIAAEESATVQNHLIEKSTEANLEIVPNSDTKDTNI